MKNYYDCTSQYCFYFGKYEFCRCKRASKSGSAATVQECRAFRNMMEDQKKAQEAKESI